MGFSSLLQIILFFCSFQLLDTSRVFTDCAWCDRPWSVHYHTQQFKHACMFHQHFNWIKFAICPMVYMYHLIYFSNPLLIHIYIGTLYVLFVAIYSHMIVTWYLHYSCSLSDHKLLSHQGPLSHGPHSHQRPQSHQGVHSHQGAHSHQGVHSHQGTHSHQQALATMQHTPGDSCLQSLFLSNLNVVFACFLSWLHWTCMITVTLRRHYAVL